MAKTEKLILSYSRIRKIENLSTLSTLRVLRLDNNELGT